MLNPWVRSEASLARTHVKHYYRERFLAREFWRKLVGGGVDVPGALRSFARSVAAYHSHGAAPSGAGSRFQNVMAVAIAAFRGRMLLILSGRDVTAKEFIEYAQADPYWRDTIDRRNIERHEVKDADHTFSTGEWRTQVETLTVEWIKRSFASAFR